MACGLVVLATLRVSDAIEPHGSPGRQKTDVLPKLRCHVESAQKLPGTALQVAANTDRCCRQVDFYDTNSEASRLGFVMRVFLPFRICSQSPRAYHLL
jgi:hypothetical protein